MGPTLRLEGTLRDRTAYREALSRLEAQGLVEIRHGVGTRVTDRSREAVAGTLGLMLQRRRDSAADLLEARRVLETEAAALAAARATADDLAALDEALEAMRRLTTSPDEYIAGDLRFHLTLALASHNSVLAALAESLRSALHESIAATFQVDGRTEQRLQGHERILMAVRAHDVEAARQAVATHLMATEEMLRRVGRLTDEPIGTGKPIGKGDTRR
ncbi:MAG: FadR family transcriptional regulator [Chloroflexi bacterium]|nr:FadR family transcriptional regulator [Chloroflexota bacterium]